MRGWIGVVIVLVACGKSKPEDKPGGGGAGSSGAGATGGGATPAAPTPATGGAATGGAATGGAAPATGGAAPATGGAASITYPPPGAGPHAGFDLAAIHRKLQGAWLAGGAAFSTIPNVWFLEGDTLVEIDEAGQRSTSTLRLLSPCSFFASAGGGSGVYGTFVLDGETLYQGLGNAGLVQGDKTIGCMAAGIYVHERGACTLWKRKPFARAGDEWEQEPGACGFDERKATFHGDDTNSSRKIYGRESLTLKGSVLLTRQMEGNKAERFPSLEAARARQQELVEAKAALSRPPPDLPFKAWGVSSTAPTFEANSFVWAAAAARDGTWSLRSFRYKSFMEDVVWVTGGLDAWAPSAFVHPAVGATGMKRGDAALLGIGALMPYGRFIKLDGDQAIVQYRSGNRVVEKPIEPSRVFPVKRAAWAFAAPVAYQVDGRWSDGTLVLDAGADAYVLTSSGVQKLAKSALRLVDVGKRWTKGTKVWAMKHSGISPLSFVEGRIDTIQGDGLLYTIKTADGVFEQTYDRIVDKL